LLDSSALVKLVIREPETPALRRYLASRPQRIACQLVRTEVPRVRSGSSDHARSPRPAACCNASRSSVSTTTCSTRRPSIDAAVVRSLDAIHLATRQLLTRGLEAVVTYHSRMRTAAERIGLAVASPA